MNSEYSNTTELLVVGVDEMVSKNNYFSVFPNPFLNRTTIKYKLDHPSNIKIDIYNSIGQKIKSLVNGFQNAGEHSLVFDGSNLPAGMYYYIIRSGENYESGKMMLLR